MPRFALHMEIFAMSAKEDYNDDPLSLPFFANDDNGAFARH
jgi:hypothetical protein